MKLGAALRMRREGAVLVATVGGVLTLAGVGPLQARLRAASAQCEAVVLDMRSAVFMVPPSCRPVLIDLLAGPKRLDVPMVYVTSPVIQVQVRELCRSLARYGLLRVATTSLPGASRWASTLRLELQEQPLAGLSRPVAPAA